MISCKKTFNTNIGISVPLFLTCYKIFIVYYKCNGMEIFITKIENKNSENLSKITLSKIQHSLGRNMLKYLLCKKYHINDEILERDGKPYIKNNPIYFSISHSKYLVGIAFDKNTIGLDIEFKKTRNFKSILKYFNINKDVSEKDFFQLWTVYEAEFKSGIKENILTFDLTDYILSLSFKNSNDNKICFYNVTNQHNNYLIKQIDNLPIIKNLDYKLKY